MAKLNKDDIDKFHNYGIYVPNRTIYMGSEFFDSDGESGTDGKMAETFIKNITNFIGSSGQTKSNNAE